jgi:tRNA dimethylallyltransferase
MKKYMNTLRPRSGLNNKPKVVVILGTTSSGKTGLGVKLADIFDGEIVSADSRQVYKGMDVGTGKDLKEYYIRKKDNKIKAIPYHLMDIVKPNVKFSLAKYQRLALRALNGISKNKKLPFLVGGSGLYLQAIVDDYKLAEVKTDFKLRAELEKLSAPELFEKLSKLNKDFAARLNNSDKNNKRRLARYIEIFAQSEEFVPRRVARNPNFDFLILGLDWPNEVLAARIKKRLMDRLEKENLLEEIKRLHRQHVPWSRLEGFGLEYKFGSYYLQNKMSYEEMVEKLNQAIFQFAKRQKSWWRRWEKQGVKICWVKDFREAKGMVREFLGTDGRI